jgi:signal transduction histidine kinase
MDSGLPQHEGGVLAGYHGSCVDVHARRLSGDRLAERTRALRLHERSRETQLAALALDLHGPLALVADALKLADQRPAGPGGDSLRALLKRAHGQLAESLARLEALAPERLCAGAALVAVGTVVKMAAAHVDAAMTPPCSSLAIDMPEPDMLLYADPVQLGRALAGVIEHVCGSCAPPSRVGVTVRRDDHALYLRVRTSVEAIEPKFVPRAFELARRSGAVRVAAASESAGCSARLDLVRRVLQLHGGELFALRSAGGLPGEWVMRVPLQR